jgi:hypothetical protein
MAINNVTTSPKTVKGNEKSTRQTFRRTDAGNAVQRFADAGIVHAVRVGRRLIAESEITRIKATRVSALLFHPDELVRFLAEAKVPRASGLPRVQRAPM